MKQEINTMKQLISLLFISKKMRVFLCFLIECICTIWPIDISRIKKVGEMERQQLHWKDLWLEYIVWICSSNNHQIMRHEYLADTWWCWSAQKLFHVLRALLLNPSLLRLMVFQSDGYVLSGEVSGGTVCPWPLLLPWDHQSTLHTPEEALNSIVFWALISCNPKSINHP